MSPDFGQSHKLQAHQLLFADPQHPTSGRFLLHKVWPRETCILRAILFSTLFADTSSQHPQPVCHGAVHVCLVWPWPRPCHVEDATALDERRPDHSVIEVLFRKF